MAARRLILVFGLAIVALLAGCSPGSQPAATHTPVTAVAPTPTAVAPGTAGPGASPTEVPTPSPGRTIQTMPPATTPPFDLTSTAFADGAPIPSEYSCRGADLSPELAWTGVPAGARALVLVVVDPDGHDWVHWTVLDLPPGATSLPRGVSPTATSPQQGTNDFARVGYGGPCPPSGTHRYRFTLYAVATPLGLAGHPRGTAVLETLKSAKVLGQATLSGTFRH
jgi:Raf kinase inhibitor-like YbhB/YbcL family protein